MYTRRFLSDHRFGPHDPGYFNSESFLNNNILWLSVYFLEMGQPWEIIDLFISVHQLKVTCSTNISKIFNLIPKY